MRLGIMQPYFFPYAQQFRHIAQCDRWVVFDTVSYSRKSWISRNRIANRDRGFSYVSVPVARGASGGPILSARLAESDWRSALRGQLRVYQRAPHYAQTLALLEQCLATDAQDITALNHHILQRLAEALGIVTPIQRLSALGLPLPERADPGEWALLISKSLGAAVYSNAPGGRHLFDPALYVKAGIALEFYQPQTLSYATPGFAAVPDLSVIDTLMWIGAKALGRWCHDCDTQRVSEGGKTSSDERKRATPEGDSP